jgi:hypothetical protein
VAEEELPLLPFDTPRAADLPAEWARLRAADPVPQVRLASGHEVRLATRYDDVRRVLSDSRLGRASGRRSARQGRRRPADRGRRPLSGRDAGLGRDTAKAAFMIEPTKGKSSWVTARPSTAHHGGGWSSVPQVRYLRKTGLKVQKSLDSRSARAHPYRNYADDAGDRGITVGARGRPCQVTALIETVDSFRYGGPEAGARSALDRNKALTRPEEAHAFTIAGIDPIVFVASRRVASRRVASRRAVRPFVACWPHLE